MTETLIDVMSANKPMLLAFLNTLKTLATGHLELIIRLDIVTGKQIGRAHV